MPLKATPAMAGAPVLPRPYRTLRWSAYGLGAVSWISAAFFGMYTFAFYLSSIPAGHLGQWNILVPGLYDQRNLTAVFAIAAHFATGAVILLLGPVQLIGAVRNRWPRFHRWLGRIYVCTAAVAGIGGLGFIFSKGTIGGAAMNIGFGLYGVLILLAAVQTYRNARHRRWEAHRAWAIRLFALAIGSWLYRLDYGFWLTVASPIGHTPDYRGTFDIVMSFFFYLPNLVVAELFIRAARLRAHRVFRVSTVIVLNCASLLVIVATVNIVHDYWGPAILRCLVGPGC
jgi:Predicted membrane protein (DUF2306)